MNNHEKVQLLLIYGKCNRNAREATTMYSRQYPDRYHPHYTYVQKLEKSLKENGSFNRTNAVQQQPRANPNLNEDIENQVLAYVHLNPRSSVRHVGREVGVSKTLVHKILKKYKLHPYKPDFVQHLRITDPEKRLNFISWFTVASEDDPLLINHILWTDESKFTNNGVLNKQNNRYWSNENPHWAVPTNFQTCWGTNVWIGMIGGKLLGPHFYDGTLTGRRYLDFLRDDLPVFLDDLPLDTRINMYYQQDGAPAHNSRIVQEFLKVRFGEKFIATHGPVEWPPRSPDLTPLDFFLWGHLKNAVYTDPPINIQDLKNKITHACNLLTENQILSATNRECSRRFEACVLNNGGTFEQFIE